MRKIGLIGGAGTGKSRVAELLKEMFNSYVVQADHVGHEIIKKGNKSYNLILEHFGSSILSSDGEIDRSKLGAIVFKNRSKLEQLNNFTHPYIYEKIKEEINEIIKDPSINYDYIVLEVPLMIEAGFDDLVDELWYIYSDLNVRKDRLKANRNYTDERIKAILSNQLADEAYIEKADYIINNSGNIEETLKQIKTILT